MKPDILLLLLLLTIIIILIPIIFFSNQHLMAVFYLRLIDSKSPGISR